MIIQIENMFRPDGSLVQLIDKLVEFEPNMLKWSVLDFNGVGQPPSDLSMDEFEDAIRLAPTGYKVDWHALLVFARGLEQTIDCLIVAIEPDAEFVVEDVLKDDFSSCKIAIQAFDSTEWRVQKN